MRGTLVATGGSTAPLSRTALREALIAALRRLGQPPTSGFIFCSPTLSLEDALAMAVELQPQAAWLGCTTAGQFTEEGFIQNGLVVLLMASHETDHVLRFSDQSGDSAQALEELCGGVRERAREARERGYGMATTVALVDGLGGRGELLVERLYTALSPNGEIVGGAAGDDGKFERTLVGAAGRTTATGAALLHVFSSRRWGVGVDHGLKPATDVMRVTRAIGNVVYEIDGRPAFDIYRDYAKMKGIDLQPDNAGSFFINNELGLVLFKELRKARAPLGSKDGALICAAEVPQGSGVCILGGSRDDLLAAAGRAAREASDNLGRNRAAGVLLFDCICRGTILGDDFAREIQAVRSVFPGLPLAGFLTYGEIARYRGRFDGWHNTTAVVTAIPA
jgi:hypothetical protein